MEWATLYADDKPFLTLRPPSDIPKQTNCPNCNAPINGKRCEYCGTWFIDPEEIEKEKRTPLINQQIDWLHYEIGSKIGDLQNQLSQAQISLAASMQTEGILSAMDVRSMVNQQLNSNAIASLQNSLGPSFIQIDIPVDPKENWLQKFIHKIIGG